MTKIADGPKPMPTKVDERRDAAKSLPSKPSKGVDASAPAEGAKLIAKSEPDLAAKYAADRAKQAEKWIQK